MNKTILLLPLLAVAVAAISLTAQTTDKTGVSTMFDLLKPGQFVLVKDSACGYQILIHEPMQVEQAIERIKSNRDKFGKPDGNQSTPRQIFEGGNPVVKAVTADHITLMAGNGYERHIASRAIVEISRYTRK